MPRARTRSSDDGDPQPLRPPETTREAEAIAEPPLVPEQPGVISKLLYRKEEEPEVTQAEPPDFSESEEPPELVSGNGHLELEDPEIVPPKRRKGKGRIRQRVGRFFSSLKKPFRRKEKSKRQRDITNGKRVRVFAWIFVGLIVIALARVYVFYPQRFTSEETARQAVDSRIEGQLKTLDASSVFPLQDAQAKARRMAYECFTVPNVGARTKETDEILRQQKTLADAGVPVSDKINCGWNGKGRGMVVDLQVVGDPYWIHTDRATVILQVKLYQRPGYFYFYVPFKNENGKAEFAGMPAIFGTASGAQDFLTSCDDSTEAVPVDSLAHTAQLFVNALADDSSVDLGYLVYGNARFGGFGPTVSGPKVLEVRYCGTRGKERFFAANVQFNGPNLDSQYTLPYAFGVVPNPQTSGKYQVKSFGPAPGYVGY